MVLGRLLDELSIFTMAKQKTNDDMLASMLAQSNMTHRQRQAAADGVRQSSTKEAMQELTSAVACEHESCTDCAQSDCTCRINSICVEYDPCTARNAVRMHNVRSSMACVKVQCQSGGIRTF